tara:strand:- start:14247 stop:14666 length:420 start_codon:yes stop_codon:yes gene_type:complete
MAELEENKANSLEHVLDLTKRKEISWCLSVNEYNSCEFSCELDKYNIEVNLSKNEKSQVMHLFLYIRYNGNDKNLEVDSDSIYIHNVMLNKISKELIDIIFTEHNYTWPIKKESVFDTFLDDTAQALMREKKIDNILDL